MKESTQILLLVFHSAVLFAVLFFYSVKGTTFVKTFLRQQFLTFAGISENT